MDRRHAIIYSLASLIIVVTLIGIYPFSPTRPDMAYIVKDSLKVAVVDGRIPDVEGITQQGSLIILSIKYLRPEWVPESIGDHKIVLMSPEAIQSEANTSGNYVWRLFYSDLTPVGGNFVTWTLEFYPVGPPGSRGVLAGGGIVMSYSRLPWGTWGGVASG